MIHRNKQSKLGKGGLHISPTALFNPILSYSLLSKIEFGILNISSHYRNIQVNYDLGRWTTGSGKWR